jgi:hypothetical protein
MKKQTNYILMADIISSRKSDQLRLMNDFKSLVAKTNEELKAKLLSPITITLGDEFQSVVKDLSSAVDVIFFIEEEIIKSSKTFKLRYVLLEGIIETPINARIAHGMLGSGLTAARERLTQSKKRKTRFDISIQNKNLEKAINDIFVVLQGTVDSWRPEKDYYVVAEFLEKKDYKEVAADLNKDRSLLWKREKSLRITEYFALKGVIHYLANK